MWRHLFSGRNPLAFRRGWLFVAVPLAVVILVAYAVAFLIDEPLRRYTEAKMNAALKGYTVRIGKLDFHPLGFSLDLQDTTVVQDADPDPPVAHIPLLSASVHWKALLSGRVVGDIVIERPKVTVDFKQAKKEIEDPTPIEQRGWQRALEAIYPLKVNEFKVVKADITYVDQGPFEPLRVRELDFVATNIRNVRSTQDFYPSEFRLEGVVFQSGRVVAEGRADFLAAPHAALRGDLELTGVELDYFKPVTNRYNLVVEKGTLAGKGHFEFAPHVKSLELEDATIDGVRAEYIHSPGTAAAAQRTRDEAARTAKEVANEPGILLKIDRLRVTRSAFGFVNKATTPAYRVFVSDTDLTVTNFSNQRSEGPAGVRLTGKFMGTGPTLVNAAFSADKAGPDLEVAVRIDNTSMPTMNDLFRAYGNFDVVAGRFSFYTELRVKDGAITGYVKPLFKDMTVYDPTQDRDKSFFRKAYESVVGGISKLLENRPRDEVATRAEIAGRLDNPQVNVLEVVVHLIQNAFFKAILPGLEREVRPANRART
jgi:hypothetical protein